MSEIKNSIASWGSADSIVLIAVKDVAAKSGLKVVGSSPVVVKNLTVGFCIISGAPSSSAAVIVNVTSSPAIAKRLVLFSLSSESIVALTIGAVLSIVTVVPSVLTETAVVALFSYTS